MTLPGASPWGHLRGQAAIRITRRVPRLAALTPQGRTNRNREALAKWSWLLSAAVPFMKPDFLAVALELN
jgi:hypothetical protein